MGIMATTPHFASRAARAGSRIESRQVFFVVGCQKSGTTWLQSALNGHREIALSGEGHFTSVLAPALAEAFKIHNAQFKTTFKLGNDDLLAALRMLIDRTLDLYMEAKSDPSQVRFIGDKTPEAAVAMPLLLSLYPDAKFIHIIRDGRDGVVSGWAHLTRLNQAGKFASVADYAEYFAKHHWVPYIEHARRAGASIGSRYTEIRYEAMHASPAPETRRLLEFLGADASDEAVAGCVEAGSFERLTKGRERGEADANSQFRKGVVGDFRSSLPPDAIDRFERVAAPLMKALGYPSARAVAAR